MRFLGKHSLVAVVLVLSILAGCAKNPVSDEYRFSVMSKEQELKAGEAYYPVMTQLHNGELDDRQLQQYVSKLGKRIAKVSDRPDLPYHFNVVNSSAPNAYALPGGYISLTRGLLLELENERQLAGVLAHEIAHVAARHAARRKTRGFLANILRLPNIVDVRIAGVSPTGIVNRVGRMGKRAILASYSRGDELQADSHGMRYMYEAGYHPRGMIGVQQNLLELRKEKPDLLQSFFRTHPLTEYRISQSREELKTIVRDHHQDYQQQLEQFDERVRETWKARQPAYVEFDTGVKALSKNRPDSAINHFRSAIGLYAEEALFHAFLGLAHDQLRSYERARTAYDHALERDTAVFKLQVYSGINNFELNRYSASLKNFTAARELLPGIPVVNFYIGRNHEELGNRQKAVKFYRNYLKVVKRGQRAVYCRRQLRAWGEL